MIIYGFMTPDYDAALSFAYRRAALDKMPMMIYTRVLPKAAQNEAREKYMVTSQLQNVPQWAYMLTIGTT